MTVMDFPTSPTNGQTTTDGRYYFDSSVGSTGAWRSTPLPVGGLPAGSIMAWGTNTPPANWLIADGSAVSRETYSSLFAVIGTQYGSGNGTTTFNLPDLRGRVPVGKNGGTFGTLGATGGEESHTLSTAELPTSSVIYTSNVNYYAALNAGTAGAYSAKIHANGQNSQSAFTNLQPYQVLNYIIKASAGWTAGDSELATRVGLLEQNPNISGTLTVAGTTTLNGVVKMPNNPAFLAYCSLFNTSLSAGSRFAYDQVNINVGNCFNVTTNRFTASVAGRYIFTFHNYIFNNSSTRSIVFRKNGSEYTLNDQMISYESAGADSTVEGTLMMNLAVNDYVEIYTRTSSATLSWYGRHSWFQGHLIG